MANSMEWGKTIVANLELVQSHAENLPLATQQVESGYIEGFGRLKTASLNSGFEIYGSNLLISRAINDSAALLSKCGCSEHSSFQQTLSSAMQAMLPDESDIFVSLSTSVATSLTPLLPKLVLVTHQTLHRSNHPLDLLTHPLISIGRNLSFPLPHGIATCSRALEPQLHVPASRAGPRAVHRLCRRRPDRAPPCRRAER